MCKDKTKEKGVCVACVTWANMSSTTSTTTGVKKGESQEMKNLLS